MFVCLCGIYCVIYGLMLCVFVREHLHEAGACSICGGLMVLSVGRCIVCCVAVYGV